LAAVSNKFAGEEISKFATGDEAIEELQQILDLQAYLVTQTISMKDASYEAQFVDEKAFEALSFLVICHRVLQISEEGMKISLEIMDVNEDDFLDAIQACFEMHNLRIPSSIFEVVKTLSKLLPE